MKICKSGKYHKEMDRLYSIKQDLGMTKNIIEENSDIVKEMNQRIVNLWKEYGLEYKQP